jgi:hypothetical protein
MQRFVLASMAAAILSAAAAFAADDPALRNGDPARWEEPIATPAQRLANSTKEARNAMADALKECRASADRKPCEAEARAQYARDISSAKSEFSAGRSQVPATR